jgi:hypothetical protein
MEVKEIIITILPILIGLGFLIYTIKIILSFFHKEKEKEEYNLIEPFKGD